MNRNQYAVLLMMLCALLLVSACQPIVDPRETGDLVELPLDQAEKPAEEPEEAVDTPLTAPQDAPLSVAPEGEPLDVNALTELQAQLVSRATEQMATELGVDAANITLVSIESVYWPDASLGCPEPDMVYAQMLTSGYRMLLQAADLEYIVHTSERPDSPLATCASSQ